MDVILGLILAFIVFLMANGLYALTNRPKIVPIKREERPNAALLVIDMQQDFTRATGTFAHDAQKRDAALDHINQLADQAKSAGIPVIEISHSFVEWHEKLAMKLLAKGAGVEGSPGLACDEALTFHANQHVEKHKEDSFTAPMLNRFLKDHTIGHLYITGQDANACVNATAKGALARKYDVTLIDEAILARNGDKWATASEKLVQQGAERKQAADIAFA